MLNRAVEFVISDGSRLVIGNNLTRGYCWYGMLDPFLFLLPSLPLRTIIWTCRSSRTPISVVPRTIRMIRHRCFHVIEEELLELKKEVAEDSKSRMKMEDELKEMREDIRLLKELSAGTAGTYCFNRAEKPSLQHLYYSFCHNSSSLHLAGLRDQACFDLVQRKVFSGISTENPMEHIESFEKVCSFTRANGVSPDYIKCMLFPFSLDGKVARWLNSLPTGSLTSWEQVRSAFLNHFYSKARTIALRNKITSFRQLTDEPFCDAWERFNDYRRECPHHEFDDDYLLGIFYDGVDWKFQSAMNSASNGDFMTHTTDGAFEQIENIAATSANKNEESDRSKKENSSDTQKIDELTAKVDQLLKNNQGHVFSMKQARAGQIQNQNQRQPQSNRQAVPATGNIRDVELIEFHYQLRVRLNKEAVRH
ncbi:hypothetical protein YC2023_075496 [Brassica napus]